MDLIKDNKKEGISRYNKKINLATFSTLTNPLPVANIYFATNESTLCENDRTELNKLVVDVCYLMDHKFILDIDCIGAADFRGKELSNLRLAESRAKSVHNYIISRIRYQLDKTRQLKLLPNYIISFSSIGESGAVQPAKRSVPSPEKMCMDRKVEVRISNSGLIPPITIGIMGKDNLGEILVKYLECRELNNGGRIIAVGSEGEVVKKEQKYQISKGIRSRAVDYLNPFVIITVTTSHNRLSTESNLIGYARCEAYYRPSQSGKKQVLFTAVASTELLSKKELKRYVYCPIQEMPWYEKLFGKPKTRVCRSYKKEQPGYQNDRYQMEVEFEKSVKLRVINLEKILYDKLKSSMPNIRKRIEKVLTQNVHTSEVKKAGVVN